MKNRIIKRFLSLPAGAKVALMVGGDAVFLPACMILAVALRLGSFENARETALPIQIGLAWLALPVLGLAGLYRSVVRYIDLRVLLAASLALAATLLSIYFIAFVAGFSRLPRSALLSFWFIAFAYVVASRILIRAMLHRSTTYAGHARSNAAIYGAGHAGVQLVRAMQYSNEYRPVCFFDDQRELHRKNVSTLPVYHPDSIPEIVRRHDVHEIIIAIPSATVAEKRKIMERLAPLGLPVKILPGLTEWVSGPAAISGIRDIDVADLLGRDPVPPDPNLISRNITGKAVMVTGAGGSIGSELCRQVLNQKPTCIILFDHSEYALYAIERELSSAGLAGQVQIVARLGSVLDQPLLERIMREFSVSTVYHAAAYKHVPMVEENIQQGLLNNVFGSRNVARASAASAVETCILISTDKAVRPTNAMGASKRVAELIFQAAALGSTSTRFSMVRFGNVLGSSGSVVPLFRQQIIAGGPITITHPDIIRYFMLIPEAAQLVIQAGAMARGGEVFVLDMGEPVRIIDLARSMISMSGLTERTDNNPSGDIEIRAVGLRPGEKLYEELLIGDDVTPSSHRRILCARERHIEPSLLEKMLHSMHQACVSNDPGAMRRQLMNLVPEYRNADEVNAEHTKSARANLVHLPPKADNFPI